MPHSPSHSSLKSQLNIGSRSMTSPFYESDAVMHGEDTGARNAPPPEVHLYVAKLRLDPRDTHAAYTE